LKGYAFPLLSPPDDELGGMPAELAIMIGETPFDAQAARSAGAAYLHCRNSHAAKRPLTLRSSFSPK
jgi:phosphoglycolate phosphatase-like HAD superfamily hydrolase